MFQIFIFYCNLYIVNKGIGEGGAVNIGPISPVLQVGEQSGENEHYYKVTYNILIKWIHQKNSFAPLWTMLCPASITRSPDGGYSADIRDVTDGIFILRKSDNKRK